jgi:hypothetical protein
LEVDFPNGKEQSAAVKKQNEALSKAFAIQAFPTLMLCDAKGRPYAEAGFPEEMSPASMQKELAAAQKMKVMRDGFFSKAADAKGVDKALLLVKGLEVVPPATVSSAYGEMVDEIAKLDPDDKTGFVKKAQADKAINELEAGFGELMEANKPAEAVKYIDAFLKEQKPQGEAKQKALMFKLFGLATDEKFDDAVKIADEIIKIDAETETAAMVKQIKRQLKDQ